MLEPDAPRRLAVIGGGISALSAVYELTSTPDWQSRHQITIYQMGFRLGGKGASGRSGARIEEHGLHILMGFYENTHQLMRRCYKELGRRPDEPMARWEDAFKPHDFVVHQERFAGRWIDWLVDQERLPGEPGDGTPLPTIVDYLQRLIEYVSAQYAGSPAARGLFVDEPLDCAAAPASLAAPLARRLVELGGPADPDPPAALEWARRCIVALDRDPARHQAVDYHLTVALLGRFRDWLHGELSPLLALHEKAHQSWVAIDYATTILRGLLCDKVPASGFDPLDDQEFTDWMRRHGAHEETLGSALCAAIYVLAFAYQEGRADRPNIGAGTGLRTVLRLSFGYKRSVFWLMQAGMGDIVFAPLYLVLRQRGVRFAFFHRLEHIGLDPQGCRVEALHMVRQATPRTEYEPLLDVDGLPCWPSRPHYEQLVEGAELARDGIDLESFWAPKFAAERLCLRRGEDFDEVLLAIPSSACAHVSSELVARHARWRAMLRHLEAIQTQGAQLWWRASAAGLGWTLPRAVASNGDGSLNVWSDMTHLGAQERWGDGPEAPRHLVYFCGAMPGPEHLPGREDHDFPERERRRVKAATAQWLKANAARTWPSAVDVAGRFRWELLADPAGGQGEARLDGSYFRANIDPSELYILSVRGSLKHRLRADESGVDNLFIAGDWTRNGLNIGCIESAVLSGLQAARALGAPARELPGEKDV